MTPVHRIAKDMAEERITRKLNRNEYIRWKENEAKAKKRSKEYTGGR